MQLPATPRYNFIEAGNIAVQEGCKMGYVDNIFRKGLGKICYPSFIELAIERRGYSILINEILGSECKNCEKGLLKFGII
jgi:hypothetical protein